MSIRKLTLAALLAAWALALVGCATADEAPGSTPSESIREPAHWSYEGAEGPGYWADIDTDYASCGIGAHQSPIDLPATAPTVTSSFTIGTNTTQGDVIDTGHTVQIAADEASTVEFGGDTYELVQIHSHSPSEHTVDGVAAAAEFHLVHANEDGEKLVLGVLAVEGAESEAWNPYVEAIGDASSSTIPVDVAALLPASLDSYAYEGSLTTPPCTEDVQWLVLAQPIELSVGQLSTMRAAHDHNARPTQPLGDRMIDGGMGTVVQD